MRSLLFAAASLFLAGCATLFGGTDPCREDGGETACFVRHEREYLGVWRLEPVSALAARGIEVRRAMMQDDYARFLPAVELRRAPGERPSVSVYPPPRSGPSSPRVSPMRAALDADDWQEATEAGQDFDRMPPPPLSRVEGDDITVCAHSWLAFIEYADPAAPRRRRVRRRVEHTCFESASARYAERLGAIAVRSLPGCGAVESDYHPFRTLNICGRFSGDLAAAAAAFNAYDRLALLNEDEGEQVRPLFAQGATLAWPRLCRGFGKRRRPLVRTPARRNRRHAVSRSGVRTDWRPRRDRRETSPLAGKLAAARHLAGGAGSNDMGSQGDGAFPDRKDRSGCLRASTRSLSARPAHRRRTGERMPLVTGGPIVFGGCLRRWDPWPKPPTEGAPPRPT